MATDAQVSPIEWIPRLSVMALSTILNLIILKSETTKRNTNKSAFTTKSLKYSSLSCIACGLIADIFYTLQWINGACHFSRYMATMSVILQTISMGIFQLSRLYYCFSRDKVHSDKGYPKWVFIIMVIVLPVSTFMMIAPITFFSNVHGIRIKCGINSKFQYYYTTIGDYPWIVLTGSIVVFLGVIWDITTLALYLFKIRLFREYKDAEPAVYKRILSILYKIVILTVFYDISMSITALCILVTRYLPWLEFITTSIATAQTVTFSLSMYLMLDHNVKQYTIFLRFIHRCKLYLCCCCYGYMVVEQLNDLDQDIKTLANVVNGDQKGNEKSIDTTVFQTNTIGSKEVVIYADGCELSVETKTVA